jgi:hypothetical protein
VGSPAISHCSNNQQPGAQHQQKDGQAGGDIAAGSGQSSRPFLGWGSLLLSWSGFLSGSRFPFDWGGFSLGRSSFLSGSSRSLLGEFNIQEFDNLSNFLIANLAFTESRHKLAGATDLV